MLACLQPGCRFRTSARLVSRVCWRERWLQGDLGRVGQQAHDVVAGRCARHYGLAADRQRRSVRRAACGQGQRRSGGGALHGRRILRASITRGRSRRRQTVRLGRGSAMAEGRLYIGNRRYSSWSMRGWLAVMLAGLDVEGVLIRFTRPGPTEAIGKLRRRPWCHTSNTGARASGNRWRSASTAPRSTPGFGRRIAWPGPMPDPSRGDTCRLPRLAELDVDESRA